MLTRKRKNIIAVLVVCFVMVATGFVWAEDESGSWNVTYVGNGTEIEKVVPQEKDGKTYLFLPSEADFSNLKLAVAEGKTFTGTVEGKSLSSSDINGQSVNLTELFGPMEAGKPWELQVFEGEVQIQTIILMKSANLPSIYITLEDKDLSYIHKSKNNTAKGQFLYRNGSAEIAVELAKFKGRGNSSWRDSGEKKPYNIKLDSKEELIAGAGEAKDWCLLSNHAYDKTGIHNYLAYNLYEMIDGATALKSQTVDLYVDNQYRGTYFLTEKVEVKETRVDIKETEFAVEDEKNKTLVTRGEIEEIQAVGFKHKIPTTGKRLTWLKNPENDPVLAAGLQAYQYATNAVVDIPGGFLLEMDATFYQEASWFITRRGTTFVVKEPEYASKEQVQQIAIYVQDLEDALYADSGYNSKGRYYGDYIDMESFVKRFAVDTVMNNHDMTDKSCYFYIDVEDSGLFGDQVLYAGPAWDYDRCNLDKNLFFMYKQYVEPDPLYAGRQEWARQLIRRGDMMQSLTGFSASTLRSQWESLIGKVNEAITSFLPSQAMNETLWENNFVEDAGKIKDNFATTRYSFWYGTVFNGSKNALGVTVSYDESSRTLHATVSGTASSMQWYAVGENGERMDIPGANGISYTLPEGVTTGRYGVMVTGGNPAEGCYADSGMISMFSNVAEVGERVIFKAENELVDHGEVLVATGGSLAPEQWPAVPEKTGYTGTWNISVLENIKTDTVVEAVYTPNTYSVVYDGNGAEQGRMKTDKQTYDEAFALAENTYKRKGCWFRGWNTEADGSGTAYKDKAELMNLTAEAKGTVRLYAQWGVLTYRIAYKGLRQAENLNPVTFTVEDRVVLKPLEHEDYLFTGWTWKDQETPVKHAVIKKGSAGSRTLTANWKKVAAPTKLKASLRTVSGGYDDVKLTWEKSKGAKGYNIYYKKAGDAEYTFAKAVRGKSFVIKNLEDGVKYKFKIVSYFRSGGKKYLSTTYKVISITTLTKVADVKAVKNGKKVKVSWTNIDGETGYQISVSAKKKGTQKEPLTVKTTKGGYKKIDAEKGRTLYYKVRAYKNVNGKKVCGPWSEVVSFKRK